MFALIVDSATLLARSLLMTLLGSTQLEFALHSTHRAGTAKESYYLTLSVNTGKVILLLLLILLLLVLLSTISVV